MNKLKVIDLFAGCGGLSLGFKKAGFDVVAHVEIDNKCCETLKSNAAPHELIINADITDHSSYIPELSKRFQGNVDGVIGGPPCQAYSIAGRINAKNKMHEDPRNFLFESFTHNLQKMNPKFFLFENVVGMLSARPFGLDVNKQIRDSFNRSNYSVMGDFRDCVFDMSKFGVPQRRKRVIIFGVNKSKFGDHKSIVEGFYNRMRQINIDPKTVRDSIGDLPKIFPNEWGKNSHAATVEFSEHEPRFHNERDIKIFKLLASDIETGTNKYSSTESIRELYARKTGKRSAVHKYHVLRWDEPSNTIPAHLYKDGLRHIHPDSDQARSITVREASRLMTFPDSYVLNGAKGDKYKMLGNAVPPEFAKLIAANLKEFFN